MKDTDNSDFSPDKESADPQDAASDLDLQALNLQDVDNDHQRASVNAGTNNRGKGKGGIEGDEVQDKTKAEGSGKGKARVLGPREAERLMEGYVHFHILSLWYTMLTALFCSIQGCFC